MYLRNRQYLFEKKDHLIKRLSLSASEKRKVIAFFKKKPNFENKIDWNNKNLTFKDFEKVMAVTKTERKRKVSRKGIRGLKLGKDYVRLKMDGNGEYDTVIPLHYEANKLLASNKVGGSCGRWCISYQKDKNYWNSYIFAQGLTPVFFIGKQKKFVMMLSDTSFHSFWDAEDNQLKARDLDELGFGSFRDLMASLQKQNGSKIRNARKKIDKLDSANWYKEGLKSNSISVDDPEVYFNHGMLVWEDGVWVDGTWEAGIWNDGTWKNGHWLDGTWTEGTWEKGTWEKGVWKRGVWKLGVHKDGIWENGGWQNGVWENGTWKDGAWFSGIWLDGFWEDGGWKSGTWRDGKWWDGEWWDGDWWYGTWYKGTWKKGTWENGTWKKGTWENGTWKKGTWENGWWFDGTWESGLWQGGIWEDGTWKGGTWMRGEWNGGTWEGGTDGKGNYHPAGDSPDKWNLK